MQLNPDRKNRGGRDSIVAISASLLAAALATPADAAAVEQIPADSLGFGPGQNYYEVDSAVLVYKESAGRVEAVEPASDVTWHGVDGSVFTLGLIADAVSGATPNGAVPSDRPQTFVTPVVVKGGTSSGSTSSGSTGGEGGEGGEGGGSSGAGGGTGGGGVSVTGASGGGTIITLPGGGTTVGRQYVVAPNTLPVDKGFKDRRYGFNVGWSQPVGEISDVGIGGAYSTERDYRALTIDAHVTQNFNANNTAVSLAGSVELDTSFPYGGVPTPLTAMSPVLKAIASRGKTQTGIVLGVTQVMSRHWLMQLNLSFDSQSGYEIDPYRIISVVDPVSGRPTQSLYESRPGNRQSESVFWESKLDYGPTVTDISLRYFTDSWGISSETAELAERIDLGSTFFVEPNARWYQQSAAKFFRNFLVGGQPLPQFASSDSRLGSFSAMTGGLKFGFKPTEGTELYIRGEYYDQTGTAHPADAFGQLKSQNLFSGTKAAYVLLGYTWDFD